MKRTPPRNRRFLYWIIPIIASVLIAFFKIFYKPANPNTQIISKSNNVIKPETENNNIGDVVGGNKVVNNYPSKEPVEQHKERTPPEKPKEIPPIVNNGNLSVGQQGGVVNQNSYTIPELPDRQLNDDDKEYFKSIVKPDYLIDFTIITSNSEEAQNYGLQLLGYLQKTYNVSNSTLIGISSQNRQRGNKKFYVGINDEKKLITVLVQSQH